MPINHMVVASQSVCRRDTAAVREAYDLLRRADSTVQRSGDAPGPTLFGFERLHRPIQIIIDTCFEQGLLPRRLGVDEVFGPARDVLGSQAD